MKKAVIITCNDNYDYNTRTKYVEEFLKKQGFEIKHLISDFDHRSKKYYKALHEGSIDYIHVNQYKKNLSIGRIIAQIRFAKGVEKYIKKNIPDLVYHCAPPNTTIAILSKIRKKKDFILVTEMGDMWPESIPVSELIKRILSIPLGIWAGLRDKNLYSSDAVIAECNLFRNMLIEKTHLKNIKTIYFCKQFAGGDILECQSLKDEVILVYLGSINNIIDIELIGLLIKTINREKRVKLHIIGDGENKRALIKASRNAGARVIYHGTVFDEDVKKKIFDASHFALNIMKNTVFVGMTMKSLDYFSYGIPMINNIGGDIEKMIIEEDIGFNISANNLKSCVADILKISEKNYLTLRRNVKFSHDKYFSVENFEIQLTQALDLR